MKQGPSTLNIVANARYFYMQKVNNTNYGVMIIRLLLTFFLFCHFSPPSPPDLKDGRTASVHLSKLGLREAETELATLHLVEGVDGSKQGPAVDRGVACGHDDQVLAVLFGPETGVMLEFDRYVLFERKVFL